MTVPTSAIVWQGPSAFTGADVEILVQCLRTPSRNEKTGAMVQVSIVQAGENPSLLRGTPREADVCGDCRGQKRLRGWCYEDWQPWLIGQRRHLAERVPGAAHAALREAVVPAPRARARVPGPAARALRARGAARLDGLGARGTRRRCAVMGACLELPFVQTELRLVDEERCMRCGRRWPGVFVGGALDLGALLRLPHRELDAAVRCWVGDCGGGGGRS